MRKCQAEVQSPKQVNARQKVSVKVVKESWLRILINWMSKSIDDPNWFTVLVDWCSRSGFDDRQRSKEIKFPSQLTIQDDWQSKLIDDLSWLIIFDDQSWF